MWTSMEPSKEAINRVLIVQVFLQDMRNCIFEVRPAVVSICFHDVECSSDRCTLQKANSMGLESDDV